jgi:hypothetical protein
LPKSKKANRAEGVLVSSYHSDLNDGNKEIFANVKMGRRKTVLCGIV